MSEESSDLERYNSGLLVVMAVLALVIIVVCIWEGNYLIAGIAGVLLVGIIIYLAVAYFATTQFWIDMARLGLIVLFIVLIMAYVVLTWPRRNLDTKLTC